MPTAGFQGGIFDVDGVLVDSPHERAWRDALRELMENDWADIRDRTGWSAEGFTPQVYQQVMSGKPRMAGALAGLEYFKVPDARDRVQTYADRKQALLIRLIDAGEFKAYPDALRFVLAVRAAGIPVAAASSSKNAGRFLGKIRLDTFAESEGLAYDFLRPGESLLGFFEIRLPGDLPDRGRRARRCTRAVLRCGGRRKRGAGRQGRGDGRAGGRPGRRRGSPGERARRSRRHLAGRGRRGRPGHAHARTAATLNPARVDPDPSLSVRLGRAGGR